MQNSRIDVLVIEDDLAEADLIREMLAASGQEEFSVQHVPCLADGLAMLRSRSFDVVLTDLGLPDSQGLETALAVRDEAKRAPVVVLTILDDEETALKSLRMDIQDYLVKNRINGALLRHSIRCAIERKRMEAELEHFASFPLLNPTPIIEMDSDGRVTFCNRAAEKMLGKVECLDSSNPLIPKDLPDIIRDLHEKKVRQYHRTVEVGEQVFDEMIYLAPQFNSVRIFAMDITERRRLEEDRGRLAAIVESSDDAIIAKTLDGIIVDWNRGAEKLYGYTASEMKGRHISTLVPADRSDELPQILERIGRGEDVENIETIRIAKDGRPIPVLLAVSPIRDASGKIAGASSIAHDITERKRAEEKIEELNTNLLERAAELALANQELEAFNYTVAHDLRKPLTVVNGYCQAIKEVCGNLLDVHCREYLQEAYNGTLRMNQLIDALLTFSRLAHVEPHRETLNLSGMAQAVALELRVAEPGRRVDFRITDGMIADGDAALLRVVLANLLGNAWKYTGTQGEGIIEFGTTEVDGKPAWFVRDNGAGFDMADADKLFTPFQRLPGAEEFRGHGIGLATVERIVSRHGGKIWAEGEPGKGATFYFTLTNG